MDFLNRFMEERPCIMSNYAKTLFDQNVAISSCYKFNPEFEANTVFPNPTSGFVFFNITSSVEEQGTISVQSILGEEVYSRSIHIDIWNNVIEVDFSSFAVSHGLYIITVKSANNYQSKKVIYK